MSRKSVPLSPVQRALMNVAAQNMEAVTSRAFDGYNTVLTMVAKEAGADPPQDVDVGFDREKGELYWEAEDAPLAEPVDEIQAEVAAEDPAEVTCG